MREPAGEGGADEEADAEGDADRGLFFRGAGRLPFGEQIRSVADLVRYLLTPASQTMLTAA